MTNEEIIEMAEKTGVAFASEEYPDIWQTYMHVGKKEIEAFAKLVAEKEREACAMLCLWHNNTFSQNPTLFHMAQLIRERGNT